MHKDIVPQTYFKYLRLNDSLGQLRFRKFSSKHFKWRVYLLKPRTYSISECYISQKSACRHYQEDKISVFVSVLLSNTKWHFLSRDEALAEM